MFQLNRETLKPIKSADKHVALQIFVHRHCLLDIIGQLQRCQSSHFRREAPVFTSEIRYPVWGLNPPVFHYTCLRKKIITYLAHVESHEEKSDFRPNTGQRQLQSILVNETNGSEGQACHSKQLSETFLRKAKKSMMLALEASDSKPA